MDSADDPLVACRKWVDKKGVSRARSVVQKCDQHRNNGGKTAVQHSNVQHAGCRIPLDVSYQSGSSSKEDAKSSAETATADSQPQPPELPEGRERAVEEKISIYLRLIDADAHGALHRRASRYADKKHPGLEGIRRRVFINRAVGRIFLEKEGPESLPDPLSEQLE